MYDIVGDIHGHYDLLVKLLTRMGYKYDGKIYVHPDRQVIFVGDFINRGDQIRSTVKLVRRMVESGSALSVLGNHEFNAILYSTLDKSGKLLRKQLPRYRLPLEKTLKEYAGYEEEWDDTVKWFRTLPLYLDLGEIRVVHGGWNDAHIATLNKYKGDDDKLKKRLLKEYLSNVELNTAITELVKGVELQLPKDLIIKDSNGLAYRRFRIKWWESPVGKTFREISFGNRFVLPEYTVPVEVLPEIEEYPNDAPPVFMGHYCLDEDDLFIKQNLFCVDCCLSRNKKLAAYRWNGESSLVASHLITT